MPRMPAEIRFSETLEASPAEIVAAAKKEGLEGVIAKRRDTLCEPGRRSGTWAKMRIIKGRAGARDWRLCLPLKNSDSTDRYYEGVDLIYVARVRNGFVPALRVKVFERLHRLEIKTCPSSNLPQRDKGRWGQGLTADKMAECRWLKPQLVAQIDMRTEQTSTTCATRNL